MIKSDQSRPIHFWLEQLASAQAHFSVWQTAHTLCQSSLSPNPKDSKSNNMTLPVTTTVLNFGGSFGAERKVQVCAQIHPGCSIPHAVAEALPAGRFMASLWQCVLILLGLPRIAQSQGFKKLECANFCQSLSMWLEESTTLKDLEGSSPIYIHLHPACRASKYSMAESCARTMALAVLWGYRNGMNVSRSHRLQMQRNQK